MLVTMMQVFDAETGDSGIWLPLTYIFYNIIFFQVGIWTLQDKDGVLPVAVFLFVVVVSAVSDVIMLGANYSTSVDFVDPFNNGFERLWRFSAGMMILNLVGKPFTVALSIVSIFFRVRTGISTGGAQSRDGTYQSVGST
jgi:hypothetical protein